MVRTAPFDAQDLDPHHDPEGGDRPINIIVCSDGTGNVDVKNRGTNVFKLYEMVDVSGHTVDANLTRQVAIYDDGIGTESNKYLSILSGAFGFGLKRNIRELYIALSRVYRPGDRLYLFGFSRGAFTIRALSGLVNTIGAIKPPENDKPGEWKKRAVAAQREFRNEHLHRALLQFLLALVIDRFPWRPAYDKSNYVSSRPEKPGVEVQFVGVWDTVDAVGFPLAGLSAFWNEVVYRFKFTEYVISKSVRHGAHALALDDQRKTFWPLLWNESDETETEVVRGRWSWWHDIKNNVSKWYYHLVLMLTDLAIDEQEDPPHDSRARRVQAWTAAQLGRNNPQGKSNITQVWFAGMHSNVGGGYRRQGMSLVSLAWMLEQMDRSADKDGIDPVRLAKVQRQDLLERVSVNDKMYDSRSGAALFYRFSPRRVRWLCHTNAVPVEVHSSVYKRIRHGSEEYAPGNIPASVIERDIEDNAESQNKGRNAFLAARRYDFLRKVIQRCFYLMMLSWVITTLDARPGNTVDFPDLAVHFGNFIATVTHAIVLSVGAILGAIGMIFNLLSSTAAAWLANLGSGIWTWLQSTGASLVKLLPGGEWIHSNLVTTAFDNPPLLSAFVIGIALILICSGWAKRRSNALLSSAWSAIVR